MFPLLFLYFAYPWTVVWESNCCHLQGFLWSWNLKKKNYIWILECYSPPIFGSDFLFCSRGEPKCWYSVPGSEATAFEKVCLGFFLYLYTVTSSTKLIFKKIVCNWLLILLLWFFQPCACRIKGWHRNQPSLFLYMHYLSLFIYPFIYYFFIIALKWWSKVIIWFYIILTMILKFQLYKQTNTHELRLLNLNSHIIRIFFI